MDKFKEGATSDDAMVDYVAGVFVNPYSFQGVLYIFEYCMLYRIFETNCSVNLINAFVFLKKCLPTDPSVGTNKG